MPAKADAKEAAPAASVEKPEPDGKVQAEKTTPEKAAAKARGAAIRAWIPAMAAIVIAPGASFALAQYVLLPRLQKELAVPAAALDSPAAPAGKKGAKGGEADAPPAYQFKDITVNLAGTMGTRYLKTSFLVTGSDSALNSIFEDNKARLTDITLNVLSSLTLSDLEEPGSKNLLREKLVTAYNQALGRTVADQVYFSDFVVQ